MIFRGVPLPSMFLSYQWGHWIFCLGGGGGGGGGRGGYFDRVLCFYVLFIAVLVSLFWVLVVCSIFSLFRILVVFCF